MNDVGMMREKMGPMVREKCAVADDGGRQVDGPLGSRAASSKEKFTLCFSVIVLCKVNEKRKETVEKFNASTGSSEKILRKT